MFKVRVREKCFNGVEVKCGCRTNPLEDDREICGGVCWESCRAGCGDGGHSFCRYCADIEVVRVGWMGGECAQIEDYKCE